LGHRRIRYDAEESRNGVQNAEVTDGALLRSDTASATLAGSTSALQEAITVTTPESTAGPSYSAIAVPTESTDAGGGNPRLAAAGKIRIESPRNCHTKSISPTEMELGSQVAVHATGLARITGAGAQSRSRDTEKLESGTSRRVIFRSSMTTVPENHNHPIRSPAATRFA
jgi:hypothetical protein